jgi:hypothetical protein
MTSNNSQTPPVVDLIYILDESGSMEKMGPEPIQGVNSLVKEQKETLDDGAKFTLIKFSNQVRYVYDDVPLKDVPEFTEKDYQPNNATALLDAIGTAITTKKAKKKNKDVVVVVMTDGQENASRIFRSRTQIREMVQEVERELNWKFIYLAANQDAFASGQRIGISTCTGYNYTHEGYRDVTTQTSAAVSAYRTTTHTTGKTPRHVNIQPSSTTAPARLSSQPHQPRHSPRRIFVESGESH